MCGEGFSHKANLIEHLNCHKIPELLICVPSVAKASHTKPIYTDANGNIKGTSATKDLSKTISTKKQQGNTHKQLSFPGIHCCRECGAVFLSQSFLKEHETKYHIESVDTETDDLTNTHEEAIVMHI